jgi:hypothetical protein
MNVRKMVATAAIAFTAFTAGAATHHTTQNPFLHPCKTEGQNGCYWDAKHMGNGKGRSYVVTKSGQLFQFEPNVSEDAQHPFRDYKQR